MRNPVLFLLFFLSGFCGLVYQIVWTRMAFARFGTITPVLSVVIAVFMLGLSLGAWAGGRWVNLVMKKTGWPAVSLYASAELLIGLGAFTVPMLFARGARLLWRAGGTDSFTYLILSAAVVSCSVLPWCTLMGATFPLMMAHVREREAESWDSFSYLYLANVLGAMSGTILTALVLVEMFGFRCTLRFAATINFLISGVAIWLGLAGRSERPISLMDRGSILDPAMPFSNANPVGNRVLPFEASRFVMWALFTTGFSSMAMEVVWTRAFGPVLKTQVYSLASIIAAYLGATFLGSLVYRRQLRQEQLRPTAELLALVGAAACLPVLANDCRIVQADGQWDPDLCSAGIVLASIWPFCALLGYLTPCLVDKYGRGSPQRAGKAYGVNVLGCILGPLFAFYVLLPWIGERFALTLLALPFLAFFCWCFKALPYKRRLGLGVLAGAAVGGSFLFTRSFDEQVLRLGKGAVVRRDCAASVLSFGEGRRRSLVVNGIGMTTLTPVTKFMAHLPLVLHDGQPQSALIICFGMGTTFRSALSWNLQTTAVELVPSVVEAFGFYHADAPQVLSNPKGRIVVDDGRRYLERTRDHYDIILIDPPPPLESASSSLLYSTEFNELARRHLKPGGVLQTWVPSNGPAVRAALRSLCDVFPHTRCFVSVEGWGVHMLASMEPIQIREVAELVARVPDAARKDLLEWNQDSTIQGLLTQLLHREIPVANILNPDDRTRITDDHPYNEYFLLKAWGLLHPRYG